MANIKASFIAHHEDKYNGFKSIGVISGGGGEEGVILDHKEQSLPDYTEPVYDVGGGGGTYIDPTIHTPAPVGVPVSGSNQGIYVPEPDPDTTPAINPVVQYPYVPPAQPMGNDEDYNPIKDPAIDDVMPILYPVDTNEQPYITPGDDVMQDLQPGVNIPRLPTKPNQTATGGGGGNETATDPKAKDVSKPFPWWILLVILAVAAYLYFEKKGGI